MCVLGGEEMKVIYQLNENQIKQLHALYQQEWWTKERSLEETQKIVKNSQIVIAIVDEKDVLVGFVRVLTDYTFKAMIFDLIVSSKYRGERIGKSLLDLVLGHKSLDLVKHFELYCLEEMNGFYKQFGFSRELGKLNLMRVEKD